MKDSFDEPITGEAAPWLRIAGVALLGLLGWVVER
jgi:LPXTG-motif cell wall-anchored protein